MLCQDNTKKPVYYCKTTLTNENKARDAAEVALRRLRARRKKKVERRVLCSSRADDGVAAARRRLKEYSKSKQIKAEFRHTSNGWYTPQVAANLARLEQSKKKAQDHQRLSQKQERKHIIAERLRVLNDYVAHVLKGKFGVFERGSFLLRNGPSFESWRPEAHFWRPGPYNNPCLTSHDGPRLSNHRLFLPYIPKSPFSYRPLIFFPRRHKNTNNFLQGGPRWRLATTSILQKVRRKQVNKTRTFLQRRGAL